MARAWPPGRAPVGTRMPLCACSFTRACPGVCDSQRVEYFKGSKLVDVLTGPKYKGKLAKDMPIKTRAEAAKLAQELLKIGYIHRSQRVQHGAQAPVRLSMLSC